MNPQKVKTSNKIKDVVNKKMFDDAKNEFVDMVKLVKQMEAGESDGRESVGGVRGVEATDN
jgi:hypothetical protein